MMMKHFLSIFLHVSILSIFFSCEKVNEIKIKTTAQWNKVRGLLSNSQRAPAGEPIKIFFIKNQAHVQRKDQELIATVGMTLEKGDRVKTERTSFVILSFASGSNLKVLPMSQLTIENPIGKEGHGNKDNVQDSFLLDLGGIFVNFINPDGELSFKVRTKTSSMAVRGTQFMAALSGPDGDMRMAVLEGKVAVESFALQKEYMVITGQGIIVDNSGKMDRPQSHKWVQLIKWGDVTSGIPSEGILKNIENVKNLYEQAEKKLEEEREAEKKAREKEKDKDMGEENTDSKMQRSDSGEVLESESKGGTEGTKSANGKVDTLEAIKKTGQGLLEKSIGLDEAVKGMNSHYKDLEDARNEN